MSGDDWRASEAFRARAIRFAGLREHDGWSIKTYAIAYRDAALDWRRFESAFTPALAALPTPAVTLERPGLAFVIAHQGRGLDYFVLNWWDNENELFCRVFIRTHDGEWRQSAGSESWCVWDLQVM
jgi:hypothetical protein